MRLCGLYTGEKGLLRSFVPLSRLIYVMSILENPMLSELISWHREHVDVFFS